MSDGRFRRERDRVVGEEVWTATARNGVELRVLPTDRFREACAVVTFGYGSTDLGFQTAPGRWHHSPEGVAHFLEHELFEDEDLHVFERFGSRGARVNAYTGFARTTYYFQCTSQFGANFDDLLRLCARVHLSDARVEKERGIIAQELRMYEDGPEYRGFFGLLGAMYREHPIRHPVGGTVESIARIDVAELDACFRAFYRAGNAGVAVAGPVDPAAVLAAVDAWELPTGGAPERHVPADLGPPITPHLEMTVSAARPRLLIGYKDASLLDDVEERAMRELSTRVLFDRLLGATSEIREDLQRHGVLDDSLSLSYLSERNFGVAVVACETDDPAATEAALRSVLETPVDFDAADLERIRRKHLGSFVRSLDSVQSMAFTLAEEALEHTAPFRALPRMTALDRTDVLARQRELFHQGLSATAVVREPKS